MGWTYFVDNHFKIIYSSKSTLTAVTLRSKPADTTSLYSLAPVPAELKVNQMTVVLYNKLFYF
jgi:hypothetical protein